MKFFKKIFLIIVAFLVTISLSTLFISCPPKPTEEIIEKTIEEVTTKEATEEPTTTKEETTEVTKEVTTIEETTITEEIEETIIESAEEEIEEETTKEIIQDLYVGEILVAENFCEFTIHSVENYEAKSESEFLQPEEGFRLIAVDVEVKNISNEVQVYSDLNYEAQDSNGYVYGFGLHHHESKEPRFGAGYISSGQTRRGWVTVEVKEDAEIVAIIAQPFFIESPPVTIKLHKPLKP